MWCSGKISKFWFSKHSLDKENGNIVAGHVTNIKALRPISTQEISLFRRITFYKIFFLLKIFVSGNRLLCSYKIFPREGGLVDWPFVFG